MTRAPIRIYSDEVLTLSEMRDDPPEIWDFVLGFFAFVLGLVISINHMAPWLLTDPANFLEIFA